MLHMTTSAEVIELSGKTGPKSPSNRQVMGSVAALLGSRKQLTVTALADAIGMKSSTLYTRLGGKTEFGASEVAAIAHYFGVRVSDLYDGLGGRIPPAPLPSAVLVRPGSDSNGSPTAYESVSSRHLHLVAA